MDKEKFFDKYENLIFEISKKGGKALSKQLSALLKELETDGNFLKSSNKNKRVFVKIAAVLKSYFAKLGKAISKGLFSVFTEMMNINSAYFGIDIDPFKSKFFENIGFNTEGVILKNSPLFKLVQDTGVTSFVLNLINQGIRRKAELSKIVQKVTELFVPKQLTDSSIITKQLVKNGGFNFLAQQDRQVSNELAKEVGFSHAVYAGTKKNNTRDFCLQRIGRIYTRKAIEKMDSLKWKGKYTVNHKCVKDCGGFSCRHHWNWISEAQAKDLAKKRGKTINSYNF